MNRLQILAITILGVALAIASAWQAGRFAALVAEAKRLESEQATWVEENRKLAAGISVLSSRERAAASAAAFGLEKATASRRLFVALPSPGKGRTDG